MPTATAIPSSTLDAVFPPPPNNPSLFTSVPGQLPGATKESTDTLLRLLKENQQKWHIFFNERGFHNHTSHHLYAIYALGASDKVLEAAYVANANYQRDAFDSPEELTETTWTKHFDDENYYRAYLNFFTKSVLEIGSVPTLEKYVFGQPVNWIDSIKDVKGQPQMLNRFLSGVLHPFIHAGHALEFDAPGMMAEGLAMGCVQPGTDLDILIPKSFFSADSLTSRLASQLTLGSGKSSKTGTHAFSIIAQMQKDPDLSAEALGIAPQEFFPFGKVLAKQGDKIRQYAEKWTIDANNKDEVSAKVEELTFLVVLLHGVGGLQGKKFNSNFFSMHLVTSFLFIPAFVAKLSPTSTSLLLRSYFASALAVWVACFRPTISITDFYANTSTEIKVPGSQPTPHAKALVSSKHDGTHPNPWLPLLQSTIVHPDEHLPKCQRALAHYAREYGTRAKGHWKGTELEGAEELDGSIFLRIAILTISSLGWMREGEDRGSWGFLAPGGTENIQAPKRDL